MTIVDVAQCCGCRGCVQICPKDAISVQYDIFGFERVQIDKDKCIECGRCKDVCPVINNRKTTSHFECGSAYAINEITKGKGSSGGLFGVFAEEIIKQGGVVYGAAFDTDLKLKTTRAENTDQLLPLLKSKYLLCDTTNAFREIKEDLNSKKTVLYCASPCQLAALKGFLSKEYENLICVEFICHGVGSQQQFDKSIKYIEDKNYIKIHRFGFREKFKGASSHYYYYYYSDLRSGEKKTRRDIYMTFPYYYAYSDRLTCREVCYHCPFATEERVGDITIGDFHNIEKYEPHIDRFSGVSMFICNTSKGSELLNIVKDKLSITSYDIKTIFCNNRFSGLEEPPINRSKFLNALAAEPYESVVKRFFNYRKDWRYYYYKLPKKIRIIGNKLLRRT